MTFSLRYSRSRFWVHDGRRLFRQIHKNSLKTLISQQRPKCSVTSSKQHDDSFLGFSPDFDSFPAVGELLDNCLELGEASIPAGDGQPDRNAFRLWQQQLAIQGVILTLIGPANINSVTFWYWRKGERDKDPFWCRPWPSGLALADHILRNPSLVKGKRVIELGAGVGAPGIAAALSGAYEVVVTDREPLALRCAALSAQASGVLQPASIVTGSGLKQDALSFALENSSQPSMEVTRYVPTGSETLSFGNHDLCAQLPGAPVSLQLVRSAVRETEAVFEGKDVVSSPGQHKQLFSCELLDWSQSAPEHLLGRFDVILATDVLYEHFSVPMLARVVSALSARADQGNTANVLGPDLSGQMGEPSVTRVPNLVQTTTQDEGRGVSKLLLVEYPDRYPSNLRNMQTLLQEPAVNLHLEGILDYETPLPCFTNEMLDIDVGSPLHPVIRTHFITFTETIPS